MLVGFTCLDEKTSMSKSMSIKKQSFIRKAMLECVYYHCHFHHSIHLPSPSLFLQQSPAGDHNHKKWHSYSLIA